MLRPSTSISVVAKCRAADLGAWLSYGLGSETDELPAFVVMTGITKNTSVEIFYDFYWGRVFCRRVSESNSEAAVTPFSRSNPDGISREVRRGWLDDIAAINELKLKEFGDPEIATRIAQYEMGFKMQSSIPELADFSDESQETLELYGPDVKEPGTFAHNCLLARRLIERGSRYVQLMHAGWDQHNSLTTELYNQCRDTDQPSRRSGDGSETSRIAGRHRHLGRRIRTHAIPAR